MKFSQWIESNLYTAGRGSPYKDGMHPKKLAKAAGYASWSIVYKWLDGNEVPGPDRLAKISKHFGVKLPSHFDPEDKPLKPTRRPAGETLVVGAVEAGAFRELDLSRQDDPRAIYVMPDPTYPNARQIAWDVRGDSMNMAGILDGDVIVGVDFQDTGLALANGMKVVVEQNRDGLIEWSVKEAVVMSDRVEFQPRSTNTKHRPIVLMNKDRNTHSKEIRVLALVRKAIREFA